MDFEDISIIFKAGSPSVLVSILSVKGSSPRHAGSKMFLRGPSSILGTVGGGTGEAEAVAAAGRAFTERRSLVIENTMHGTAATGSQMICGGRNKFLIEYIQEPEPYRLASLFLQAGARSLFVKRITRGPNADEALVGLNLYDQRGDLVFGGGEGIPHAAVLSALGSGKASLDEEAGLFYDPIVPREKLLIIGGGHVGKAIAKAASNLDFDISVCDDRPEFLAPEDYPPSTNLLQGDYTKIIDSFPFDSATYAVVVTRSHSIDLACVRSVLGKTYRYAGLIGSKNKIRLIKEQALSEGFDSRRVGELYTPIGIDIGAESPAEIAISILAEIISVKRGVSASSSFRQAKGLSCGQGPSA